MVKKNAPLKREARVLADCQKEQPQRFKVEPL